MTYSDTDGVNGTNPQTITGISLAGVSCTSDLDVCQHVTDPVADYSSIQTAIENASNAETICVCADGPAETYNENIDFLGKDITVITNGGTYEITIAGTAGTNLPVVTFDTSETSSAILDGFTIDNQYAYQSTRGIYISGASPTIKNTTIQDNTISNAGNGAGVYINNSAPTFDTCTIRANTSTNRSGCGMYIEGAAGGAIITNTTIGGTVTGDGNKCSGGNKGGAIYYTGSTTGTLEISDSNIQFNEGFTDGGGIYLNAITNTTLISNTTILDNYTQISSQGSGGGIHAANAPLSITGGSISSNTSGADRAGGGLYISGSSAIITGTTINSNSTGSVGGGGIYFGGTTLNLSKINIRGNSSKSDGGGINIVSGIATISNSIITGNRHTLAYRDGGGISNRGTLNLYFSTIADNYSAGDGGGLYAAGTENIYNSIIWGNVAAGSNPEINGVTETLYLTETGSDTSFDSRSTASSSTATIDGSYLLQSSSNCIDTGDATNKPTGDDDIEGNTRPQDIVGKGDGVDDYDKGAYEYVAP